MFFSSDMSQGYLASAVRLKLYHRSEERTVEFAPGEVVQLKSGGPPMTVERIGKDPTTQ